MAIAKKQLPEEKNTGFGTRSGQAGGRFYRKDGRPNVIRTGVPFINRRSWYHALLSMPQWKFWTCLLATYISVNFLFAFIYFAIGVEHLNGIEAGGSFRDQYMEAFFFSAQTYSTVGYGHVSPRGALASGVAAFEAFLGVLTFALASGLFYGRFSKPRSFLRFSEHALIAPYNGGRALMFRTAPYKNNHLVDAEVKLTLALREGLPGEEKNEFYPLEVEYDRVNSLVLNWTIVHPITESSPLWGMEQADLIAARAELLVFLKAFDEGFSNTVVSRTSYAAEEMISGARFEAMYEPHSSGQHTVLHLDRLNAWEKAELPPMPAGSE